MRKKGKQLLWLPLVLTYGAGSNLILDPYEMRHADLIRNLVRVIASCEVDLNTEVILLILLYGPWG